MVCYCSGLRLTALNTAAQTFPRPHHLTVGTIGLVTLLQRMATDFEGVEPEAFDAVIQPVVQYFPNIDYLVRVIEGRYRLHPVALSS